MRGTVTDAPTHEPGPGPHPHRTLASLFKRLTRPAPQQGEIHWTPNAELNIPDRRTSHHFGLVVGGPKSVGNPVRVAAGTSHPATQDIQKRYFEVDPATDLEVPRPPPRAPMDKRTYFLMKKPPIPVNPDRFTGYVGRLVAAKIAEMKAVHAKVQKDGF